jgi:hypothetical protein
MMGPGPEPCTNAREHQGATEPEKIEGEDVEVLTELRGDEDAPEEPE